MPQSPNSEAPHPAGLSRRGLMKSAMGLAAMGVAGLSRSLFAGETPRLVPFRRPERTGLIRRGRIRQALAAWCYTGENGAKWTLDQLCQFTKQSGITAVEVLDPKDFPTVKAHGLVCSLTNSHMFVKGMNQRGHWDECLGKIRSAIDANAAAGFRNVITFTGFSDTRKEGGGIVSPEEGLRNCVEGYKKIVGYAEKKKVTLCLEQLNSRDPAEMKGHPGYQGDHLDFCIEIVRKVGSPSLKLLFDIYHVSIMDGDVIRRIGQCSEWIGHVHMAGTPGRNEIGWDQEINYPAVLTALLKTGYRGYCAHEWLPTRNAEESLTEMIRLVDI